SEAAVGDYRRALNGRYAQEYEKYKDSHAAYSLLSLLNPLWWLGALLGVDVNPQMLAVARRVAPTVDWREGDAGALPLRDGEQFDVVLCQQGFQFFQDQAEAVALMVERMASMPDMALHARAHQGLIQRFGRFPGRNEALARANTPEEERFLQEGGYGALIRSIKP
ncbi:MAG: DUF924 family protein, partial [Tabrizicola sp.]|nr:DUF924 family protein [Tabrizicola sp.]